jgi:hypothetical protein
MTMATRFDSAFKRPASAATGLPMGVEELARAPAGAPLRGTGLPPGVEQRAREQAALSPDVGPQRPMIYQGGRINQPLPAVTADPAGGAAPAAPARPPVPQATGQMPQMQTAARPPLPGEDPRGLGARSPLGGYDPRPLSERGPMRPPRGVGTTNPNATRVGPIRAPGERELTRAARRGNWRAAGMLYGTATGQEFEREMQGQQMQGRMTMAEQERADRMKFWQMDQDSRREAEGRGMLREDRNWERDTQRRSAEADADRAFRLEQWQREQEAAGDPTDVRAVPVPGTDYVVPMSGRKAMGTLPAQRPPAPGMTQEEIEQARQQGGRVKVTRPGGEEVTYEPPAAAPAERRMQRVPAQPGVTASDPGTPERMFDPYTGEMWEMDPATGQPRRVSGPVPRGQGGSEKQPYNPFAK